MFEKLTLTKLDFEGIEPRRGKGREEKGIEGKGRREEEGRR